MKLAIALATSTMFAASAYAFAPAVRNGVARSFGLSPSVTIRSQSSLLMMAAAPAEFVKQEIASNDVVVFSKSYCPYCRQTKSTLEALNIPAKVIELDEIPDGDVIQAALLEESGQRTVPNVFVKGQHIGGNDDTQAAVQSGKFQEMLK